MKEVMHSLAVSQHVSNAGGGMHCFSLHNRVINLTNIAQEIVTLHCYNSGLSPMGWSFKPDDFDLIYNKISHNHHIEQHPNGDILIADTLLLKKRRPLKLNILPIQALSQDIIRTQLTSVDHATGLFGPLKQNIRYDVDTQLQKLIQQFILLLSNQPFDLKPFLGLGPGLTPSFDDTIVGILAVLHSEPRLSINLPSIIAKIQDLKLEQLTTKVSAAFLTQALNGHFSLNLLAVIPLFRQYKSTNLAIKRLLGYGHSSGADLLLGIWLGTLVLQALSLKKR